MYELPGLREVPPVTKRFMRGGSFRAVAHLRRDGRQNWALQPKATACGFAGEVLAL
jgi:hypothetical protein